MQFGFTLKPEHSIKRSLALTRQAEAAGFNYGWLFDSHVLWRDPYPLLTLMAQATMKVSWNAMSALLPVGAVDGRRPCARVVGSQQRLADRPDGQIVEVEGV